MGLKKIPISNKRIQLFAVIIAIYFFLVVLRILNFSFIDALINNPWLDLFFIVCSVFSFFYSVSFAKEGPTREDVNNSIDDALLKKDKENKNIIAKAIEDAEKERIMDGRFKRESTF